MDDASLHPFTNSIAIVKKMIDKNDSLLLDEIIQSWNELVGVLVGAHSRPTLVKDSILVVAVDSPPTKTSLTLASRKIIAELTSRGYGFTGIETQLRSRVKAQTLNVEGDNVGK
jgi:hypothetical protein